MAVLLDAALAASRDLRVDTRTARLAGDNTSAGLPAGTYVARLQVVEAAALDGATDAVAVGSVYSTHGGLAAVEFMLNTPPAHGTLSLSPLAGEAMSTRFTLSAPGWRDADTPLSYLFWYQVSGE